MHKKIVIVGSGTAGLISAVMMRNYWRGKVDISLYHDSTDKTIAVGESTTPIIGLLLQHLGITTTKFLEEFKDNATIKLGINFKNWIPNKEFFHGFIQVGVNSSDSTGVYTIPRGSFNSGILYSRPTTFIPDLPFEQYTHALHIDTEEFIKYLLSLIHI